MLYLNIYLRGKDDFYPIIAIDDETIEYDLLCKDAPYGKIRPLRQDYVNELKKGLTRKINNLRKSLKKQKRQLYVFTGIKNTFRETAKAINEINDSISETEERIENYKKALSVFDCLDMMLFEASETKYYEDKSRIIDPDKYIYFGIECWCPSVYLIDDNMIVRS